MGKNTITMAAVTVLKRSGFETFETMNVGQLQKLQEWVEEVKPTQPPPEKIGAVVPWCTITFCVTANGKSIPIATNSIYAIRDRSTEYRLLTGEQRQRLLDIFGQKLEE
jgi:hypothetical protein